MKNRAGLLMSDGTILWIDTKKPLPRDRFRALYEALSRW